MGEQALRCEIVVSSYVCQPNHSYMYVLHLHSDHTRGCVVAGVLHSVWQNYPTKGLPYMCVGLQYYS